MLKAVLMAALLGGAGGASAFGVPVEVKIGIPHQALYAVSFDGSQGVAVGAYGEVLASSDSGATWNAESVPGQLSLLGVVVRGGRSIAVGQTGLVLLRDGEGKAGAWREIKSGTAERLLAVDLNSHGLAFAVGGFGTVLKSTDGGLNWTAAAPDWAPLFATEKDSLGEGFHPHLYTVKVDEKGRVIIAGELSYILVSDDAGGHWRVAHSGINNGLDRIDPSIFGLDVRVDGVGFAVGQSGSVFKTTDHGGNWTRLDAGSSAILLGVEASAGGPVVLTGIREMLASRDDGVTWQRVSGGDVASVWYAAAARPEGAPAVLAVGQAGRILKLPD